RSWRRISPTITSTPRISLPRPLSRVFSQPLPNDLGDLESSSVEPKKNPDHRCDRGSSCAIPEMELQEGAVNPRELLRLLLAQSPGEAGRDVRVVDGRIELL